MTTFRYESGLTVSTQLRNILDRRADVCLFGRNQPLRKHLQEATGRRFSPYRELIDGRTSEILDCSRSELPWSRAVSLLYTARTFAPKEGTSPSEVRHLQSLRKDIHFLLHELVYDFNPWSIAVLGLSWRNPEIAACATVAAISELMRSLQGDHRLYPGHLRSYDLNNTLKAGDVLLSDIFLIDDRSIDIFLRAIKDADGCLTKCHVCDTPYRPPVELTRCGAGS